MDTSRDGEKAGGKRNISLWGAEGHSGEEGDDTKGQSCLALRLVTHGKILIPGKLIVFLTLKSGTVALICLFIWFSWGLFSFYD